MAIQPRAQRRHGDLNENTGANDASGGSVSPMTKKQAAILKDISEKAREPEAYSGKLSQAAAETRIRVLRAKLAKDKSGAQHKPE